MTDATMVQVTIFDPNINVYVHPGAAWDVVVQYGDELTPHTTWYLKGEQFNELINNLLKAQLSLALIDSEKRRQDAELLGAPRVENGGPLDEENNDTP